MKRRLGALMLIAAVVVGWASSALAWGAKGHRIIGHIAPASS